MKTDSLKGTDCGENTARISALVSRTMVLTSRTAAYRDVEV